ncbi:MAG: transaldolase [Trueperaceae bacterium]
MTVPQTREPTPDTRDHPLLALQRLGQSPWHDNIRRDLLTSGALQRMIADGEITGLTSNPTIFEQAIAGSDAYDDALARLAGDGRDAAAIFDALASDDLRAAADLFLPVYHRTGGADGYVSIEVAPDLAHDAERTLSEARRLWRAIDRPNLMVKIPATLAGLTAIEAAIADGINVNVTLIFSLERHRQVMRAYLAGLRRRVAAGGDVANVASVASFFVSRVDVAVDALLDERLAQGWHDPAALRALRGKAAIANAKLAYAAFREEFSEAAFGDLAAHGARLQRPLWASTSVKDPAYPDLYYVEALVGPDTVDTMPPATLAAYRDHGAPEVRIDRDLDAARAVLDGLRRADIDLDDVLERLEAAGVASFVASYEALLTVVRERAAAAAARP